MGRAARSIVILHAANEAALCWPREGQLGKTGFAHCCRDHFGLFEDEPRLMLYADAFLITSNGIPNRLDPEREQSARLRLCVFAVQAEFERDKLRWERIGRDGG